MNPARSLLVVTRTAAFVALLIGGGLAARDVLASRWVREFQAGPPSGAGERAVAIAQRAALEGVGFGAVALVLGLFAIAVSTLLPRSTRTTFAQRFSSAFVLAATAFYVWVTTGTYVGEAALPFLAPGPLFLLNLAGFSATLVGLGVLNALAKRVPGAARGTPAAVALGTSAAALVACSMALDLARDGEGAWRSAGRLALVAGTFLAAVPAGALLSRLLRTPVAWIETRLARGRILPFWFVLSASLLLLVCAAISVPTFELSAVPRQVTYKRLESRGTPTGPNVIYVVIDTLRADHLSCYGYDRPTSPFLDSVAAEGVRFADPLSPAAWTKPSTGTILTGLYPSRHGALYHGSSLRLPEGHRTLAETFRNAGYVTAGFVTNPNVKKVFAFDRGFDEFFDSPVEDTITLASIRGSFFGGFLMDLMRHQFNWKYENDVLQMNRHVFSWLRQNSGERFFLYLHYIDPHIPYEPPPAYRKQFAGDHGFPLLNERKRLVGTDLYDAEIRYADDGLSQLADQLRELGLWEDTLFVLTSDHGEEFFEHGVLGHGFSLYQGVIQVPLIARGPGIVPGTVVEQPVQILDLPATVLDLAGTGVDALGDGHSFAALARGAAEEWRPAGPYFLENEFGQDHTDNRSFVLNGVREGDYKLVLTERNAFFPPEDPRYGRQALYDLGADPGENENVISEAAHRATVERLLERLRQHSRFLSETGFRDVEPAALSPDIQKSLEALGY